MILSQFPQSAFVLIMEIRDKRVFCVNTRTCYVYRIEDRQSVNRVNISIENRSSMDRDKTSLELIIRRPCVRAHTRLHIRTYIRTRGHTRTHRVRLLYHNVDTIKLIIRNMSRSEKSVQWANVRQRTFAFAKGIGD